jgi:hypothetical protein
VAPGATDRPLFVVAVGAPAVATNVGAAFLVGAVRWLVRTRGFR